MILNDDSAQDISIVDDAAAIDGVNGVDDYGDGDDDDNDGDDDS